MKIDNDAVQLDRPVIFEIRHRHGIRNLMRDFQFLGDFSRRSFAMEALLSEAKLIEAKGGRVQILASLV
jgi:hypothetical protein